MAWFIWSAWQMASGPSRRMQASVKQMIWPRLTWYVYKCLTGTSVNTIVKPQHCNHEQTGEKNCFYVYSNTMSRSSVNSESYTPSGIPSHWEHWCWHSVSWWPSGKSQHWIISTWEAIQVLQPTPSGI